MIEYAKKEFSLEDLMKDIPVLVDVELKLTSVKFPSIPVHDLVVRPGTESLADG